MTVPLKPIVYRPISTWPGQLTPDRARRNASFRATIAKTLPQLDLELRAIAADDVVIELAVTEADIRIDGKLRARVQFDHPGVVLSFDSAYGPLRYATDVFRGWENNLRAITLGLADLRRIERYGITKRGEQYQGWRALEAGPTQTRQQARDFLMTVVKGIGGLPVDDVTDAFLVKMGKRFGHPDYPDGTHDTFLLVQQAAATLGFDV